MLKLEADQTLSSTIEDSDVGIVIKRNGDYKVFTVAAPKSVGELTPEQEKQGRIFMCLLLALQSKDIMNELQARLDEQMGQGVDFISEDGRH